MIQINTIYYTTICKIIFTFDIFDFGPDCMDILYNWNFCLGVNYLKMLLF